MYIWGSPWGCPDPRLSRVRATLGDIDWVGQPHYGPCFLLQQLTGWWGGGAVSGGAVPFENGDGSVQGDTHLHGRVVTLRGKILTDNGSQQMDAFDELAAVFARGRWQILSVEEPERGIERMLTVTPVSLPDPQPISNIAATVSVTVESAGYPLLDIVQESATVTSGGVDLTNFGTYPAAVMVTLTGPLTNPGLSWPGGAWTYSGTVPSGTTLQVDMARRVVRNPATTAHSRNQAAGTWLSLPPGTTRVSRTGSGSGSITARWRSSWS